MTHRITILFFFLGAFLFAQDNFRVTKVKFEGNQSIPSRTLLGKMSLQPKFGLTRLGNTNDVIFSEMLLENDIAELTYLYQQNGFIHVQIRGKVIDVNERRQSLKILVSIEEGQPVHISQIKVINSENHYTSRIDSVAQRARSNFSLTLGEQFSESLFQNDLALLRSELINSGFAFSDVTYTLNVNAQANTVGINIYITPGPLCRFGETTMSGAGNISPSIVTKQLAFRTGDIFSQRKIEKSQEQIFSLKVFRIASLVPQRSEAANAVIPIGITLREAPRFTHKYGVGWGREEEFRAVVDIEWLRFLGGARRFNVYLKHSALEPHHIDLRFTQPAFLHPSTSAGFNPFLQRQHEPGYKVDRYGSNFYLQYQIRTTTTAGATYTYETVTLDTSSVATLEKSVDVEKLDKLYNKSSLTLTFAHNNTDAVFSPRRGWTLGVSYKWNGLGPSSYYYHKGVVDVSYYTPMANMVLAGRLKVGRIYSLAESGFVPVEDRFFAGGANSVRGWARHELGPKDNSGKPIGGSALIEGSFEFRIPIFGALTCAIFWDVGQVGENQIDFRQRLSKSFGMGLRYHTLIGPIRFDIAGPIDNWDKQIRWYLSIGEAF